MVFKRVVTKDSVVFEGKTYPLYDEKVYKDGKLTYGDLYVGTDNEDTDNFCFVIQYKDTSVARIEQFGTSHSFCKLQMQGIDRPSYVLTLYCTEN